MLFPDSGRLVVQAPDKTVGLLKQSTIYLWIVPARIAGYWRGTLAGPEGEEPVVLDFTQRFQKFDGVAKSGKLKIKLQTTTLKGDQLSFMFFTKPGDNSTRHEFKGTVKGDLIEGTLKLGTGAGQKQLPWSAQLRQRAEMAMLFKSPTLPQ